MASGSGSQQPGSAPPDIGQHLSELFRKTGFQSDNPGQQPVIQQQQVPFQQAGSQQAGNPGQQQAPFQQAGLQPAGNPGQQPVIQKQKRPFWLPGFLPADIQQPGFQRPAQHPFLPQPGSQQPGSEQPGSQQPGSQQPGSQQPGSQQPGSQQPGFQQPGYQQPVIHQPVPQQPSGVPPAWPQSQPPQPAQAPQYGPQQTVPQLPTSFQQPGPQQAGPQQPGPIQPGLYGKYDPRPLSPWAARYGIVPHDAPDPAYKRDNVQHSCFAPDRNPWLDPVLYGQDIKGGQWGRFQSGDHKDRFFLADERFKRAFQGNRPWQLGPLQRVLRFSGSRYIPGGHFTTQVDPARTYPEIFNAEGIKVDESKWFSFLKRDRWYSSEANEPILAQNSWTVDDPMIWKELSISLELANRMLSALIEDKHPFFQTLLYGKFMAWSAAARILGCNFPEPYEDAKVLISPGVFKQKWIEIIPNQPCSVDVIMTYSATEWRERLESLLTRQQWALHPTDNPAFLTRIAGVTYKHHDNLILLNVVSMRSLMKGNITLSERCLLYFLQAKVILHELSHAIGNVRMARDASPNLNMLPQKEAMRGEAYVDFNGTAEMGYWMESIVFGGAVNIASNPGTDCIPLQPYAATWPFPDQSGDSLLGRVAKGHPHFADGIENKFTLIPSIFASTLLSERFWTNPNIPRKSDNYFHMTRCFNSKTPHNKAVGQASNYRTEVILENRDKLQAMYAEGKLDKGLAEMIRDWDMRKQLYNDARAGWYHLEKYVWHESSWGGLYQRNLLNKFNDEWDKGPQGRDLYACVHVANQLSNSIKFTIDQNTYVDRLTTRPSAWVWHALGLLMNAALPIRHYDCARPAFQQYVNRVLVPSSQMAQTAPQGKTFNDNVLNDFYPRKCHKTHYFDPLRHDGLSIDVATHNITQVDFLDLVKCLVRFWAQRDQGVSTAWLTEILRVESKLRLYWARLEHNLPDPKAHAKEWAEGAWDFEIPEYDPLTFSFWNQNDEMWESMVVPHGSAPYTSTPQRPQPQAPGLPLPSQPVVT